MRSGSAARYHCARATSDCRPEGWRIRESWPNLLDKVRFHKFDFCISSAPIYKLMIGALSKNRRMILIAQTLASYEQPRDVGLSA